MLDWSWDTGAGSLCVISADGGDNEIVGGDRGECKGDIRIIEKDSLFRPSLSPSFPF